MNSQILTSVIGSMIMVDRNGSLFSKVFVLLFTQLIIICTTSLEPIIMSWFKRLYKKTNCSTCCTASIFTQTNGLHTWQFSTAYSAIQCALHDKICKESGKYSYYVEDATENIKIVCFLDENTKYMIESDIVLEHKKEPLVLKNDVSIQVYKITLTSVNNNYLRLRTYIDECLFQYEMKQIGRQKICLFDRSEGRSNHPVFEILNFDTTKTFDNMFFEHKQKIIETIDLFQANEHEYHRMGIPYTLGFMFYGDPGKTSVIKAIANYTKRHIISIPFSKIKSMSMLKKIFLTPMINGYKIPNDKRVYVFEEIDCAEWEFVVRSRHLKTNTSEISKAASEISSLIRDIKEKSDDNDDNVTLGGLLELLDGIVEIPGRMIIMTSNHPEHIDPALMRPGRIDVNIEFKKLRRRDISDMYRLWFSERMPECVFQNIKDYTFTQAEIGNIFASKNKHLIRKKLCMECDIHRC